MKKKGRAARCGASWCARSRQRGVVLVLIVLTLTVLAGAAWLFATVSVGQRKVAADNRIDRQRLVADLKQALFGYVLSTPISDTTYNRPGALPNPDTWKNSNYNGQSDSACLSSTNATNGGLPSASGTASTQRCLGRWPWAVIPIDLSAAARNADGTLAAQDPTGAIPWLAISANLSLTNACYFELNSDVLNKTYTAFNCSKTSYATTLPYPWLTVRGADGSVLTNRAAAVIILPGESLQREDGYRQTRTSAAPGMPKDYLDRVALPLGCLTTCTGTYDNAGLTNEFISLPPGTRYPANAEDASKSGEVPFNDVIAYITIDELMVYLERRVLIELKEALKKFAATPASPSGTIGYPWAADLATPTDDSVYIAKPGTIVGMLPFFATPSLEAVPTGYATGYSYNIPSLQPPAKVCVKVQASPDRWVNIAENTANDVSAWLGTSSGIGTWEGNATELTLAAGNSTPTTMFSKTFTLYSASNCSTISSSPSSVSYSMTRAVSILANKPPCVSTPTVTYFAGSTTQTQRRNWSCEQINAAVNEFEISITDTLASPISVTKTYPVYPVNKTKVTINAMRYQPPMASWYFENGWYKQAFYAVANQAAPATTTNCSSTATLTVGTQTGVTALALLSGKSLANATRPSLPVSDYLEGANATAAMNCVFAAVTQQTGSTYNDHSVIVAP